DQQGHGDDDAHDRLKPRRAQDAAMLDDIAGQQDGSTQEERGVDTQLQPFLDETEVGDVPLAGGYANPGRAEPGQDVAGGDARPNGKHRRPGEPVAPDGKGTEDLAVMDPGRGAIDRRTPRFVREQAGDLGIGEGLDEAHQDGERPDDVGGRADGG